MDSIIQKVKTKYYYLSDNEVLELIENAKGWFYALRYPCEPNVNEETRPITTFMDEWNLRRL
jgi:hypothetical protein